MLGDGGLIFPKVKCEAGQYLIIFSNVCAILKNQYIFNGEKKPHLYFSDLKMSECF